MKVAVLFFAMSFCFVAFGSESKIQCRPTGGIAEVVFVGTDYGQQIENVFFGEEVVHCQNIIVCTPHSSVNQQVCGNELSDLYFKILHPSSDSLSVEVYSKTTGLVKRVEGCYFTYCGSSR